jgi:hypothetical protein
LQEVYYKELIHLRNSHTSLRIGSLTLISTDNSFLFASLHVSSDEAVIALINLSDQPITDYNLSVKANSLNAGTYQALPLMGEGVFADLTASDKGVFKAYKPLAEIPTYATIILQLRTK